MQFLFKLLPAVIFHYFFKKMFASHILNLSLTTFKNKLTMWNSEFNKKWIIHLRSLLSVIFFVFYAGKNQRNPSLFHCEYFLLFVCLFTPPHSYHRKFKWRMFTLNYYWEFGFSTCVQTELKKKYTHIDDIDLNLRYKC